MQAVITILVFIILLSVIVLIHEFGHYFTAIKFGIKAEEFGWGFPPKVWGKKIGKTLFTINLFPIGGFVRLKGEDSTAASREDKDSYASQSAGKRALVIAAGILLNFVLAIAIFQTLIMLSSYKLSAQQTPFEFEYKFVNRKIDVISTTLTPDGEVNEESQLSKVLQVNGWEVTSAREFDEHVKDNSTSADVTIITEDLESGSQSTEVGTISTKIKISQVGENSVAQEAGLQKDDVIVSANSKSIFSISDIQSVIRLSEGQDVEIGYVKSGEQDVTISPVIPAYSEELENYAIGISMFQENYLKRADGSELGFIVFENPTINFESLPQKVFAGAILAENMIELQVKGLSSIISKSVATNDLTPIQESVAGPLGIVGITSFAVEQGVFSVLMLAGTLSLIIGMFNLLPVPALDGGRLFFVLVELVSRRRVNANFEKWAHTVGFFILIFLIILITYNDILRFLREGTLFTFPDF